MECRCCYASPFHLMELILLFLVACAVRASATCSYPGITNDPHNQIPCYPDDSREDRGLCCYEGDYCGNKLVCQDSTKGNETYLGGCRDNSATSCGVLCQSAEGAVIAAVEDCRRDGWWCCGKDCCADDKAAYEKFPTDIVFQSTRLNGSSTQTSEKSSTSTSSSRSISSVTTSSPRSIPTRTSTSTSTSSGPPISKILFHKSSRDQSKSVALGAGLGVGFAFIFLALIFTFLWWRRGRTPKQTPIPIPQEDLPEVVVEPSMAEANRMFDWRFEEPVLVRTNVAEGSSAVEGHRR